MHVSEQVAIIYAGTQGLVDKVPVAMIKDFEAKFISYLKDSNNKVLNEIKETNELKSLDEFNKTISDFVEKYLDSIK
jgi:F-type H+/Na+-transporting ATPase subunit alpha